jgi:hypothetical protein
MIPDFEELMRRAETGDKEAQYELAQRYQMIGDNNSAEKYYKASAKQGYAPAQHELGALKEFIYKDIEGAKSLYKKAAEQGYGPSIQALENGNNG